MFILLQLLAEQCSEDTHVPQAVGGMHKLFLTVLVVCCVSV